MDDSGPTHGRDSNNTSRLASAVEPILRPIERPGSPVSVCDLPAEIPSYDLCDLETIGHCSLLESNFFESSGFADTTDLCFSKDEIADFEQARSSLSVHFDGQAIADEPTRQPDALVTALHSLDLQISSLGITRTQFYRDLRLHETLLGSTSPERGHLDGGSMATTTDQRHLLWYPRPIVGPTPKLRVADDHAHRPTLQGYLCIRTKDDKDYRLVPSYFTPTLPATIVSPDSARQHYGCLGYTAVSHVDGNNCEVRLEHCSKSAEDLHIPATLVRGLLYTDPLLPPPSDPSGLPAHLREPHVTPAASTDSSPIERVCACTGSGACCTSIDLDFSKPTLSLARQSALDRPIADLTQRVLHFQRLGYQPDIDFELLSRNTLGTPTFDNDSECVCHQLRTDQERVLWHQRLGHMHSRRVSDLHKHAHGVPKVPIANELDTCPVCAKAKIRFAARQTADSRRATRCGQGISVDFGFIVQQSSVDSHRLRRLQGLHGEVCYCLIVDHYSGRLWGRCFPSKAPPLEYLNEWLVKHGLDDSVPDRYVRFDLGGDLGACQEVVDLFTKAGYEVEPTAAQASASNGPGERPHQTIGDALRAMLAGANLPAKFWPYAFHHFIRLYNVVAHGSRDKSPYTICTGLVPNLRMLRVFGCRVYALPQRPNRRRMDKLFSDARTGIFLGFTRTMRNVLYYDIETETVKQCQHVVFDESFNDLTEKPPNARLLDAVRRHPQQTPDLADLELEFPDLEVHHEPFLQLQTIDVRTDFDSDRPLGFGIAQCDRLRRAYVQDFTRAPERQTLRAARKHLRGSYVLQIGDQRVYSANDAHAAITHYADSTDPPERLTVVLAPERRTDYSHRPPPLHLRLNDLRRIAALQSGAGEDMTPRELQSHITSIEESLRGIAPDNVHLPNLHVASVDAESVGTPNVDFQEISTSSDPDIEVGEDYCVFKVQVDGMTEEERNLKSFTRRSLQRLSNWPVWDAAFDKQLDQHFDGGTIGEPVLRSSVPSEYQKNVLRIVWNNYVKPGGSRKARACLDGSERSAPWLRAFTKTYSSCLGHPGLRIFISLAARNGLTIGFGDTVNAFQQSPPPSTPCFLIIDEAVKSWYRKRFGKDLDWDKYVLPLNKALQGHPEAGVLWERLITHIFIEELKLRKTTHEPNVYSGTFEGELILACRQVDDYAVATRDQESKKRLIAVINKHVITEYHGMGVEIPGKGLYYRFDGVDILQTREYVKLSAESYIDRVLLSHGWDSPAPKESDRDRPPINPDHIDQLQEYEGPAEGTNEHTTLKERMNFSYRQVLGELIFAYVICRLDIGYAITFLAKYSTKPHEEHYKALKGVCRYLRRTKDWGLVYHRGRLTVPSLPDVPFPFLPEDDSLPPFPVINLDELTGFGDSSHASDKKTRRSMTSYGAMYANAVVLFKVKLQPTVATSSTEAELISSVDAGKGIKFARSIYRELGFPQESPTRLFLDNAATIAIVNDSIPTPRVRHVDIQYFAIQEWRQAGDLVLMHIPGVINPSDAGTKALGWMLHTRHVRRFMGHYAPR